MKLIDADELKKVSEEVVTKYGDCYTGQMVFGMEIICEYATKHAPTVDAMPVVRCKDCKYYEETDSRIGTCLLTISGAEVGGFCAWGEWRGDGDVV